jgi:HTH-type transcriptional regulator / antitoxin HigA
MELRPIRTEEEYKAALAQIDALGDPRPGTPEGDKLDLLFLLVEAYEDAVHPITPPDPIAALEHYLDRKGLAYKDLEPIIGSQVWEVMQRRMPLTLEMIRRLVRATDIPAAILIQPYETMTMPA